MRKPWRDHSVSIVVLVLFLASWIGQGIFQWFDMANAAQAHGETNTLTGFLPAFFATTLENWQSGFLQLFMIVLMAAFLIQRRSHRSKDHIGPRTRTRRSSRPLPGRDRRAGRTRSQDDPALPAGQRLPRTRHCRPSRDDPGPL